MDGKEEIVLAQVGSGNKYIKNNNNVTFKPIKLENRGPLMIKNKRWYYRLVQAKKGEQKRSRALMDDYDINEISKHMVVCYTPRYFPNSRKPFKTKDGDDIRIYAFFESYIDFYKYMQEFDPKERGFYEIIFGELPQKPHFDLDINKSDINEEENIDVVAEEVKEKLIDSIIYILNENNVTIEIEKDILLYSSHGDTKRSFHIIINNKCHDGNKEAQAFYNGVMTHLSKNIDNRYLRFVDKSVYSPRQQFRIIGNQKIDSNRPKVFYEQFKYKNKEYTHIYNEDVSNPMIKKLTIIYESLISFTSGCSYIPSLLPEKIYNNNYDDTDIDNTIVELCMSLLHNKMPNAPFSLKEVRGHVICLKRNAPSLCPICCNKDPHHKENPFIYVIGGKVFWDCRRCPDPTKKLFLGYLVMSYDDLNKYSTMTNNNTDNIEELSDEDDSIPVGFSFGNYNIGLPTLDKITPSETIQDPNNIRNKPDIKFKPQNSSQPDLTFNNIKIGNRIKDVQSHVNKIASEWARKKYVRKEPENIIGTNYLSTISNETKWTPGLK